jgi:predicted deoxyguanosinetriphosphate triphosphohydrolase
MNFEGDRKFLEGRADGYAKWAAPSDPYSPTPPDDLETRTRFKHDEDEITYSKAFRRLSHKSQIVVRPESDHFRSRLTHTIEVKQIAESIADRLGFNTNLVNAIALGHDLGHCPFGHAGEREIQLIMRSELLGKNHCCDQQKLTEILAEYFDVDDVQLLMDPHGVPMNDHLLFHHAVNSYKILERKMEDVTDETKKGVLSHSWGPWQPDDNLKFGVPPSYEAQAVAIADQIAGMNHDTEDILSCTESEYNLASITNELPDFFEKNGGTHAGGEDFLDWFLPNDATKDTGWSRKKRLQSIINSIVESTRQILEEGEGATADNAVEKSLRLDHDMGNKLRLYESFVREKVIKTVSWFRHRDSVAEAVIRTTYNFFKHYGFVKHAVVYKSNEMKQLVESRIKDFRDSIEEEHYDRDSFYHAVRASALDDKGGYLKQVFQTMDYVAGMTDKLNMEVHKLALDLFR